jgi:hypothetical protein
MMEIRPRKKQRLERSLTEIGTDVLSTIAAFTDLADIASFALTSSLFAGALKAAGPSLWPLLATKHAPAVIALYPMLPNPKPPFLSFIQRHFNVKAASARPRPALVPTTSLADYLFSYELVEESGKAGVAWAGQAQFAGQSNADVILPLSGS